MASAQTTANTDGAPGAVPAVLAPPHGKHTSEGTAYERDRQPPAGGAGAPLLLARGHGPGLVDADGRAWLDLHPG